MNSDEVNWLLQTIEEPENAKCFVQAQYQRGRIPSHVMASLAQERNWTDWPAVEKTGCVDFNGVHYDTANDSRCNGALTRTEVMKVRDFATKAKEHEFAAVAKHRDSIAFPCSERCTKSVASAQIAYGHVPEGASATDLVHSMQEKTGPASQKGRVA